MNETSRPEGGPPRPLLTVADARDALAGVVVAREEQALGECEQAAAILADLDADQTEPATHAMPAERLWVVLMVSRTLAVAESILRGLPVRAGNLDAEALRRALRGGPLPNSDTFILVSGEMLDAVNEAGPMVAPKRRR